MPHLYEKRAFEHGLRIALKLMEGAANEAMAAGKPGHANFLLGVVDGAEKEIPNIVGMYARMGFDEFWKMVTSVTIVPEN